MTAVTAEWKGLMLAPVLVVAAVMVGLFAVDQLLATVERADIRSEARRLAAEGDRLLAEHRGKEAAVRYQRAHSLVREDRQYALGYAQALLASGDLERARTTLHDILEQQSNDGRANLLMARTLVLLHQPADADFFYHRAIYGTWPGNTEKSRNQARKELVEWLASRPDLSSDHPADELLAELITLQASPEQDPGTAQKLAELFLVADSPSRAAAAYRTLISREPSNKAAYAGLAEAELRSGNYRSAERAFMDALRKDPSNVELTHRMEMMSAVIALDPTPRQLPTLEKYRRSVNLVERCAAELRECAGPAGGNASGDLLATADQIEKERVKQPVTNELSESRLALAAALWHQRMTVCKSEPAADDPLPVIMNRLK